MKSSPRESPMPLYANRLAMTVVCGLALAAQAQSPSAPSGEKPDGVTWTRFTDPVENAFFIDVPAGWKAEGGLVRRSPVDYSMFLRALSPDNAIMLIVG